MIVTLGRQKLLGFHLRLVVCAIVAIMVVASGGCLRRRLFVRSNPAGALAYVDDQQLGLTPTSTEFTYYGTRKIRVEKDGFETATVSRTFYPPWYEFPGLDFIVENIWPWEVHDDREVDLHLAPLKMVPRNELTGRAEILRTSAQQMAPRPELTGRTEAIRAIDEPPLVTPLPPVGPSFPNTSSFRGSPSPASRY